MHNQLNLCKKRAENEVLGDFIDLNWLDEPDIAYSDRE